MGLIRHTVVTLDVWGTCLKIYNSLVWSVEVWTLLAYPLPKWLGLYLGGALTACAPLVRSRPWHILRSVCLFVSLHYLVKYLTPFPITVAIVHFLCCHPVVSSTSRCSGLWCHPVVSSTSSRCSGMWCHPVVSSTSSRCSGMWCHPVVSSTSRCSGMWCHTL